MSVQNRKLIRVCTAIVSYSVKYYVIGFRFKNIIRREYVKERVFIPYQLGIRVLDSRFSYIGQMSKSGVFLTVVANFQYQRPNLRMRYNFLHCVQMNNGKKQNHSSAVYAT